MKKVLFIIFGIIIVLVAITIILTRYKPSDNSIPTTVKPKPNYSETTRTIKKDGEIVYIDFEQCTEDLRRIDVAFGSTTIGVVGKDNGNCILIYGGEVENPNWDGELKNKCSIPISLGKTTFKSGPYGVDLSTISQYCN